MLRYSKIALIAGCFALFTQLGNGSFAAVENAKVPQQVVPPAKPAPAPVQPVRKKARNPITGLASWYGQLFDGQKTASGEVFDQGQMTACHHTLPFGTLVRVFAPATGRSVVVKINDRGTLRPGRVIDLSSAAARSLGILRMGVARVQLEVLRGGATDARLENNGMLPAY